MISYYTRNHKDNDSKIIIIKTMNEVIQDKMKREIMVIKNTILFQDISRVSWFIKVNGKDFEEKLLWNYEYMQRGQAEVNFDYKQPIPYGVVQELSTWKIFLYKRGGAGSNAGDTRLHSKISIGVGGHIEKTDKVSENLMIDCLLREIEEEMGIKKEAVQGVELLGGINDDGNEVGKVHFGMCYLVQVDNLEFALEDGELESGSFVSLDQIWDMIASGEYDVETWTQILYEPLKQILK